MQPSSIDALGGGRARRGGGPHGLAQQGEDSSVEKQRYYSLTLLPPKGVPLHLLALFFLKSLEWNEKLEKRKK